MTKKNKTLLDIYNQLIDNKLDKENLYMDIGTVVSVNEEELTFIYKSSKGIGEDVVNMSLLNSENYVVPEVDSIVLIGYIDKTEKYCIQTEKAEKIIMRGGNNEGLINIVDLTEKLNGLVAKVNAIANLLQTWIIVPGDGGAALKAAAISTLTNASNFSKSDYEDEKITH